MVPNDEQMASSSSDILQRGTPENISQRSSPTEGPSDVLNWDEIFEKFYHIKWIDFQGASYAILMQNENGPCPLLAISNVLLLRGQISFLNGWKRVTETDLLQIIADCILRFRPKNLSESDELNYEQNISDVLSLVPSLPRGLDVNLEFTGVRKFEYTTASALFDLLDVSLLHGWIIDPQQTELVKLLNGISYNKLVEKVINLDDSNSESKLLRNFMENSSSQLTVHGLCELSLSLTDGQIAVLFRNNHFHTLYKHRDELFVLVTDMGFLNEPSVVWETLNSVDGDSFFVDANFHTSLQTTKQDETADYFLALSMQEEERKQAEALRIMSENTVSPESIDQKLTSATTPKRPERCVLF